MKILLTNDDGIDAPGLQVLLQALETEHECLVVAPVRERSASSHSISLGQKLVVEERSPFRFAVHGTPADCVKFALSEIKDSRPDLLISGINPGPNTGVSVYYSGTISAAREGLINRVPGMAISIARRGVRSDTPTDFSPAISVTRWLIEGYAQFLFPRDIFLNVNIPALPEPEIRGIKVARQAPSRFIEEFIQENVSGRERVYALAGEIQVFDPDGTTDEEVLKEGFISLTPLQLDLTAYSAFPLLEKWVRRGETLWASSKNT